MILKDLINTIENFAPLETQEKWDSSGWQIFSQKTDINKVLLCLTPTEDIVKQALDKNCDVIISHHPIFFIPFGFNKNIGIYSAHTNLDKTEGGTTDTLIKILGYKNQISVGEFLRIVELDNPITLNDFALNAKICLNLFNLRIVNNKNKQEIKKIAFCAGSGADFLDEAEKLGADLFVTGDVKYHTAIDSNVIIADVGHFGSEKPVLNTLKSLLSQIEVVIADEKDPFINY